MSAQLTDIRTVNPINIAITEIGARLRTRPELVSGKSTTALRQAEALIASDADRLLGPPTMVAARLWETARIRYGVER